MIRYLSLCSGIEAASVAWQQLGWQPVAFAEIDPFPCAVLAHHYPDVPNLGDMTTINGSNYRGTADLIVGGTPCQSFSVAGKRGGLSDPRGALAFAFVKLVRDVSPHPKSYKLHWRRWPRRQQGPRRLLHPHHQI